MPVTTAVPPLAVHVAMESVTCALPPPVATAVEVILDTLHSAYAKDPLPLEFASALQLPWVNVDAVPPELETDFAVPSNDWAPDEELAPVEIAVA